MVAQNLNFSAVLVAHQLHFSPGLHVVALPLKGHSFTVLGPTEFRILIAKAQDGAAAPDWLSVHPETNHCHQRDGIH